MSDRDELNALRRLAELEAKAQGPSKTLPANAGLANLAANIAGLPADTVERGINLTRAAQGALAGALGKTDWMPPLLTGSLGGSDWIKEKLRLTKEPGLSPDDPSTTKLGKAQYDLVSRGGAVPGGFLPAAGSMIAEKIAGPEWAGVGALLPQAAITATNAATAPGRRVAEQRNSLRDQTLREGRNAGYVVPPSKMGAGPLSNALESLGGKAAMGQESALRNQGVTTQLAKKDVELPKDSPLSMPALEAQRNRLASPYREVAGLSQEAASTLEKLKQVRFDTNAYFKHYDVSADPASLAKARSLSEESKALEKALEGFAKAAGKPQLVQELRDARMNIAKTFDVERALNVATGDVSAPVLGRMIDQGKQLSGGLATAGRFQQAFPHEMREGASVPPPVAGALAPITALGLGMGGFQVGGPLGALAGAVPFLRAPTRSLLLSDMYQNAMMPNYGPAMNPAPAPQLLYQLGIIPQQ